jgi:hypothetical protein
MVSRRVATIEMACPLHQAYDRNQGSQKPQPADDQVWSLRGLSHSDYRYEDEKNESGSQTGISAGEKG